MLNRFSFFLHRLVGAFFLLFSIKSTFCHILWMWFWYTLILVFPVRQNRHKPLFYRHTSSNSSSTICLNVWNRTFILHISLYYLSIYYFMLDGLSLLFYRFQVCRCRRLLLRLQSIDIFYFYVPVAYTHIYKKYGRI